MNREEAEGSGAVALPLSLLLYDQVTLTTSWFFQPVNHDGKNVSQTRLLVWIENMNGLAWKTKSRNSMFHA